jgi:hypothetical protein
MKKILAILFLVLIIGCGSGLDLQPVEGIIQWQGKPVKSGTINFRSEDGRFVGTGTIVDGAYKIPKISGLVPGNYLVAISYPYQKNPAPKDGEAPGESRAVREILPLKYANGSTLKAEIKIGPNEVSFDLK